MLKEYCCRFSLISEFEDEEEEEKAAAVRGEGGEGNLQMRWWVVGEEREA